MTANMVGLGTIVEPEEATIAAVSVATMGEVDGGDRSSGGS